jgi:hypothetical protein
MPPHPTGITQHAVDTRGADRHEVAIDHHEGQPAVALEGELVMEFQDLPLLPVLEPPVTGDVGVVLVDAAVAGAPGVELALGDPQPADQAMRGDFRAIGPVADVIDDLVAGVVGNPASGQSSPSSFFN